MKRTCISFKSSGGGETAEPEEKCRETSELGLLFSSLASLRGSN